MAPMSSTETAATGESPLLTPAERDMLLGLARDSIRHGIEHAKPLPVDVAAQPEALRARRAAFVTLHRGGALRGCIGHLEAVGPLIESVAENAFNAAFRDPRFPPVAADELPELHLGISVLTPSAPMTFTDEADLLRQLRPGIDGLILSDGPYRGTFLPAVWEQLPAPRDFLRHLKRKAGLPPGHWSDTLRVSRYRTESFAEPDRAA
jgi:AmmeMemoRadiSam system protein A